MVTIPGRRIEAGPTSDGEAHPYAQSYGLERAGSSPFGNFFRILNDVTEKPVGGTCRFQSMGIQMIYRLVKRHEILAFHVGRD